MTGWIALGVIVVSVTVILCLIGSIELRNRKKNA